MMTVKEVLQTMPGEFVAVSQGGKISYSGVTRDNKFFYTRPWILSAEVKSISTPKRPGSAIIISI